VKGSKHNLTVSKLFRQKLGSAEVIPSSAVRDDLMKKLARREFMRFNPARFNIYYLGGLAAVATAVSLFLFSGLSRDEASPEVKTQIWKDTVSIVRTDSINIPLIENAGAVKETSRMGKNGTDLEKSRLKKDQENSDSVSTLTMNRYDISDLPEAVTQKTMALNQDKGKNSLKKYRMEGAAFEASAITGCLPLRVKFYNKTAEFDSCQWIFGDGGYSVEKEPLWIFDREGEYKVQLRIFYGGRPESVTSQLITVLPKPVARFEITPENAIIPDDEVRFINLSSDAVRYRWDFGDGNISDFFEPSYRYKKFDYYNVSLVVWSEYGCSDSITVENAFTGSGCFIDFPNAFIPNSSGPTGGIYSSKSDESAQVFHPEFFGVSDYQLRIFSKRGVLIFESNDVNTGWDGYFKGQLAEPGVYIWKVRGKYVNGEPFVKTGDVTVLRN